MTVKIDYELCCWKDGRCVSDSAASACGCKKNTCVGCAEKCPTGAISRGDKVEIDESLCTDCGICVDVCPHGALSME